MARGSRAISFGSAAALIVAALILAPLGAVLWRAGGFGAPGPADWAAVRFTVLQATLSALFSAALALPVARALARRKFPAHGAVVALMGAPFILPVIVAVMGLLAIFGWNGVLNDLLHAFGLPKVEIYGLHGIILAHVFFNLPLAARLLLEGWRQIPAERFRLAEQMGASPRDMFWIIEWPMLRERLPGIVAVIFAICLSSFAVVLVLGGGPAATTIELAIYQAFTFEFDLGRAATLSILQLSIVAVAALMAMWLAKTDGPGAGLDRSVAHWNRSPTLRLQDAAVLTLTALFIATPMLLLLWNGAKALPQMPTVVWSAALTSLTVALASALIATLTGLALALPRRVHRHRPQQQRIRAVTCG